MNTKLLIKLNLLLCFGFFQAAIAQQSVWETLAPGAGGQVQDLYFDPDVPDRIWLSSDQEGSYVSNDFGDSWDFIGRDLSHGMSFKIRKSPNGKYFQGGLWGAHVSTNNGQNWTRIAETKADAIATIAFNNNGSTMVLGPSWHTKDPQKIQASISDPIQPLTGERYVYISTNGGNSFSKVTYENTPGYYQVYNAFIHPTTGIIYLGTASGLYVSTDANGTSWTRIPNPTDAYLGEDGGIQTITQFRDDGTPNPNGYKFSGGISGMGFVDNGSRLYAAYQTGEAAWAVYTIQTSDIAPTNPNWVKVSNNLSDKPQWYNPVIDPRSTATNQKILLGTTFLGRENRVGLFEGTITYNANGDLVNNSWQQIIAKDEAFAFEEGWETASLISRTYSYTPTSWPERRILTGGGNSYFLSTDPSAAGWPYDEDSWLPLYTRKSDEDFGEEHTWFSTGFANTVTYDIATYENYAVQGNADQGVLESWDYGKSWTKNTVPRGITNAQSTIITNTNPPLVLIDTRPGFGIASQTIGRLYARELTDLTSQPAASDWRLIGGGTDNSNIVNGLPNRQIQGMALDDLHPSRVYLGLRSIFSVGGIYATEEIEAIFSGKANWIEISDSSMRNESAFNDLFIDPNNSNIMWAAARDLYRGVRTAPNTWTWEKYETSMQDMYVWDDNGTTRVAVALSEGDEAEVYLIENPDQPGWNNETRFISTGLTIDETLNIRPQVWVEPNETIAFGLMAGYKDQIYVGTENGKHKKGLGVFKGTINSITQVNWEDFSTDDSGKDFIYSRDNSSDSKINIESNGDVNYYIPTFGTGVYRRLIDSGVNTNGLTVDRSAIRFAAASGSEENLQINANGNWALNNIPSWLNASSVSGSGNVSIQFTTSAENVEPQNRTATVLLTSGNKEIEILVTQVGTPIPVNYVNNTFEIDGIQDSQWNALDWVNIDVNLFGSTKDSKDKFKLAYTRENLYLLVRVQDSSKNTGSDLTSDHFQIAIDVNNDKKSVPGANDYRFAITSDNSKIDLLGALDNVLYAVNAIATGYVYEVAIPWSSLDYIPVNETALGFEIQVADNQDGQGIDQANQWFTDKNLDTNNPFTWGTARINGPDVPWLETFDLAAKTTLDDGNTAWSLDLSNTNLADENDYLKVTEEGVLEARDLDGEAIFKTEIIDISQVANVSISLDAKEKGDNLREGDINYIKLFAVVDGGEEQLIDQLVGDNAEDNTFIKLSGNGLVGNQLEIIVKIANDRGGTFHSIDNLLIDFGTEEVCNVPAALRVEELTPTTATLAYSLTLDGLNTFQVEIKEVSEATWQSVEVQNELQYTFQELLPNTEYEWRVRQNCITGASTWVSGTNFTTPEAPVLTTIFEESFDATDCSPSSQATVASYECYTNSTSFFSGTAEFNDTFNDGDYEDASNGNHVFLSATDLFFEIKGINTTGYTNTFFQFAIRKNGNNQDGSDLKLEITTDGSTWSQVPVSLPSGENSADFWYVIVPEVNIVETTDFGIRFTAVGTSKYRIDDILVKGEDANQVTCDAPQNINVEDLTTESAALQWPALSAATNGYEVRFKEESAATWEPTVTIATNSFSLNNLLENTAYVFEVRTLCSANTTSAWTEKLFSTEAIGETVLFLETFDKANCSSTGSTVDTYSCYSSAATHSGSATISSTQNNGAYDGSSNGSHVFLDNPQVSYTISGISVTGYDNFKLSFGIRKNGKNQDGSNLLLEYKETSGGNWTAIPVNLPVGTDTNSFWYLIDLPGAISVNNSLDLRFTALASPRYRIDDIQVKGTPVMANKNTEVKKLKLTSMCSNEPALSRRWRISNPNQTALSVEWKLYGTSNSGVWNVPSGTSFFETPAVGGSNTLVINWLNEKDELIKTVKASSGSLCEEIVNTAQTETTAGEMSLTVYPNPVINYFTITSGSEEFIQNILIYNLAGQLVKTIKINSPLQQVKVDATAWLSGLYLVRIQTNSNTSDYKIFKE
ncbi:fibronectin type III domain-containing protein [Galbibacter sp. BG1]|uniref:sugar-binding protein n=1 Tax=Galbibacter sp. BG1 TaxID=1170699 RepID=UPI0015B87FAD|nr:sugar-binding protein [Galbibacter sp. BG1]QLE02194.1 fibronectin type III domain-containing protein [Galbibacter sp. BG1]